MGPKKGICLALLINSLVFKLPTLEFVSENLEAKHTAPPVPISAKSLIILIVKSTTGLRVDPTVEEEGLDISTHGETNYRQ